MTLCIAALCDFVDPKVVTSFDLRGSTQVSSAENTFKLEKVTDLWWCLIAGTVSVARELVAHYRTYLKNHETEITGDNALEFLHRPAEIYKDVYRNRVAKRLTSLTYDEFLENTGRFSSNITWEIENVSIEAQLILIGYMPDPRLANSRIKIFKYDGGEVFACDNHAAIGTGATIAEAALMQREHSEIWGLPQTIYAVYEAQRLGWKAPDVGQNIAMNVFYFNKTLKQVVASMPSPQFVKSTLSEWWAEFGLREINSNLQLPDRAIMGLS